MLLGPPSDISAARLFRLLIEKRPRWPLEYRFPFASDIALYAQALSQSERRALIDAQNRDILLLAASLCDCDGRSVLSVAHAESLLANEAEALVAAVGDAHTRIQPTYATCDIDVWRKRLRDGASSNVADALALGGCIEYGYGRSAPRPDRFWGIPIVDVTEAQWLIYGVCREYYDERFGR